MTNYDLLEDGQLFMYIAGMAGTGKTYTATKWYEDDPSSRELTATTGIAAVNLGGGRTINSLLWGYHNTDSLRDFWTTGRLSQAMAAVSRSGIKEILIDECSMLSGKQLDILCMALDEHNERVYEGLLNGCDHLSLILVGDFAQLPPIKEPFAFESKYWDRFESNTRILTEIKRQTDKDYIEALHAVRRGDGEAAVEFFEPFMHKLCDPEFDGSTIFSRNAQVDRYNQLGLERCKGERLYWRNVRWGQEDKSWKNIPDKLEVKEGALVMILSNSGKDLEYCNGDLGYVLGPDPDSPGEEGWNVRLLRNDRIRFIKVCNRENVKRDARGKKEVIGKISYMPLRLAYASTTHKSQGLSLDRVQLDFRDRFFTHPGMLYVGLSRARTPEGLRLVGNPDSFIKRCQIDKKVEKWL